MIIHCEPPLANALVCFFVFQGLYSQMQALGYSLDYARLPIVDEKAPKEEDFDAMIKVMREQDKDTACVFNCQVGTWKTATWCEGYNTKTSFLYGWFV